MKAYLAPPATMSPIEFTPGYCCPACDGTFFVPQLPEMFEVLYAPDIIAGHHGECWSCGSGAENGCGDTPGGGCTYVYVRVDTGTTEYAWECENGCFNHDVGGPEDHPADPDEVSRHGNLASGTGQIWICGECGSRYAAVDYVNSGETGDSGYADDLAKEAAMECCDDD